MFNSSVLEATEFPSNWWRPSIVLLILQKIMSIEKPGSNICSSSTPKSTVQAKATFILKTVIGKWKENSFRLCCWLRTAGLLCLTAGQGQPQWQQRDLLMWHELHTTLARTNRGLNLPQPSASGISAPEHTLLVVLPKYRRGWEERWAGRTARVSGGCCAVLMKHCFSETA